MLIGDCKLAMPVNKLAVLLFMPVFFRDVAVLGLIERFTERLFNESSVPSSNFRITFTAKCRLTFFSKGQKIRRCCIFLAAAFATFENCHFVLGCLLCYLQLLFRG